MLIIIKNSLIQRPTVSVINTTNFNADVPVQKVFTKLNDTPSVPNKLLWLFLVHPFWYVSRHIIISRCIAKWMYQKSQSNL
jgi:hypothetical protein